MQKTVLIALAVALLSGITIGIQSSLNGLAGKLAGPLLTGLLVNILGGLVALLVLAAIYITQGKTALAAIELSTIGVTFTAGLVGIGIITGIAFSLPRIGVAAGIATIIAGQMIVAILVDTSGLIGGEPIPLTWSRIGGLGLLALGAWAILPKG